MQASGETNTPAAMLPRPIALVVLIVIAVAECVDVDLSALFVAQGRLLEQMQQQLQSLTAVVEALKPAEQQGREQGEQGAAMLDYFDSGLGRLLTAAPDTQRKTWQNSILHSFDVPTSCGLHAELNSDATGPMDITRLSDGNVTMGYGGAASASQPAAFEMNHPANCRTATLTANHPLMVTSLSLQGTDLTSKLLTLAAYTLPKYVRYTDWACAGKNGFMFHAPGKTFAQCEALCDAGATCASFEYSTTGQCFGSLTTDACTGSGGVGGADSANFVCVPTPSHVPAFAARVLSAFAAMRPDRQQMPEPCRSPADAHTCRPPDSRREQKFAISGSCSGACVAG